MSGDDASYVTLMNLWDFLKEQDFPDEVVVHPQDFLEISWQPLACVHEDSCWLGGVHWVRGKGLVKRLDASSVRIRASLGLEGGPMLAMTREMA